MALHKQTIHAYGDSRPCQGCHEFTQSACTDEAEDRRRNLNELVNAALQDQEENEEGSPEAFLDSAVLASDAGSKDAEQDRVNLMTLHASEQRLWGGMREPAMPSLCLSELPDELVQGDIPRSGEKISLAVKFDGMPPKILDPHLAPIQSLASSEGGG